MGERTRWGRKPQTVIRAQTARYNRAILFYRGRYYPRNFPITTLAREFGKMVRKNGRITEAKLVLNVFMRTNVRRALSMAPLRKDLMRTGRFSLKTESAKNKPQIETLLKALENDKEGSALKSIRIGLFETLALGREFGLDVATELVIVAVEVVDCMTVGGDMDPVVERAIPDIIKRVEALVGQ